MLLTVFLYKTKKAINLNTIAIPNIIPIHIEYPIVNYKVINGFSESSGNSLSLNSFSIIHSKAYLRGDKYYIHLTHIGAVLALG